MRPSMLKSQFEALDESVRALIANSVCRRKKLWGLSQNRISYNRESIAIQICSSYHSQFPGKRGEKYAR